MKDLDRWIANNNIDRLHLGCGSKYLQNFCNIDLYPTRVGEEHRGYIEKIDIIADLRELPSDGDVASLIYNSHVLEHFSFHDAILVLKEFYRVLKPGGIVVVEMPERSRVSFFSFLGGLVKTGKSLPEYGITHNLCETQFYGAYWEEESAPFAVHKFLYKKSDFISLCKSIGFEFLAATSGTFTHVPLRDVAYILMKPGSARIKDPFYEQYLSMKKTIIQKIKGLLIIFYRR